VVLCVVHHRQHQLLIVVNKLHPTALTSAQKHFNEKPLAALNNLLRIVWMMSVDVIPTVHGSPMNRSVEERVDDVC
jgi:hypothetical protein